MIKINSISSVIYYVSDLDKTAEFYETLGFRFGERKDDYLKCYVNWFWVEFHVADKALAKADSQQFTGVSVENVDEFYDHLVTKGIKPDSQPEDKPWGRREFVASDPDGYKWLFFKKK